MKRNQCLCGQKLKPCTTLPNAAGSSYYSGGIWSSSSPIPSSAPGIAPAHEPASCMCQLARNHDLPAPRDVLSGIVGVEAVSTNPPRKAPHPVWKNSLNSSTYWTPDNARLDHRHQIQPPSTSISIAPPPSRAYPPYRQTNPATPGLLYIHLVMLYLWTVTSDYL